MIFSSQRCTVKHPKASKQCRCQVQRQKGGVSGTSSGFGDLWERERIVIHTNCGLKR